MQGSNLGTVSTLVTGSVGKSCVSLSMIQYTM